MALEVKDYLNDLKDFSESNSIDDLLSGIKSLINNYSQRNPSDTCFKDFYHLGNEDNQCLLENFRISSNHTQNTLKIPLRAYQNSGVNLEKPGKDRIFNELEADMVKNNSQYSYENIKNLECFDKDQVDSDILDKNLSHTDFTAVYKLLLKIDKICKENESNQKPSKVFKNSEKHSAPDSIPLTNLNIFSKKPKILTPNTDFTQTMASRLLTDTFNEPQILQSSKPANYIIKKLRSSTTASASSSLQNCCTKTLKDQESLIQKISILES